MLKLPVLVHHYLRHEQQDDTKKSLLAFLQEHYAEEHGNTANDKDHEDLPFKSHHTCISQVPVFCSAILRFDCSVDKPVSSIKKIVRPEQFHYATALSKIWQPPRLV